MPSFLVPKKTLQHRVASIALYRALLSQCSRAPITESERTALRNVARNRFRANRELTSPSLLKCAFSAGYEALDILDSSVAGNAASTDKLKSIIPQLRPGLKRILGLAPAKTSKPKARSPSACLPPEQSTLVTRPHVQISGIRKIPKLISAGGIPMLRYKKPQPPNLSRIIKYKIVKRQKSINLRNDIMDFWMPLAGFEDEWDVLLGKMSNLALEDDAGFRSTYENIMEAEVAAHIRQRKQDAEIAQRMQEIVDQEIRLAREEKLERRRAARAAKRARKEAEDSGTIEGSPSGGSDGNSKPIETK